MCAAERGQFGFATACGAKARGAGRPLLHGREGAPATPRHGASAIGGGARGPPSLATPPASAGRPRAAPWADITSEAPSARRGHSVPEARGGRRARACSAADGRGTEIGARRWSSNRCSILPPRGLRALEAASPPRGGPARRATAARAAPPRRAGYLGAPPGDLGKPAVAAGAELEASERRGRSTKRTSSSSQALLRGELPSLAARRSPARPLSAAQIFKRTPTIENYNFLLFLLYPKHNFWNLEVQYH